MNNKICIGTSGFGISRVEYVRRFSCVEVQHTFYQPPQLTTLERWRREAPTEFEFTLKAWQLITHDARSPTYRRLKRKLTELEKRDAGYFRFTPIVEEAWEATVACANALQSKTILFQCPVSFKPTQENILSFKNFFRCIEPQKNHHHFNFCWEPRGEWDNKVVKDLCAELNLGHVVDPFVSQSVTPNLRYFRLHGRNGWRYEYDDAELRELMNMLFPGSAANSRGKAKGYVFFNNMRMTDDAARFRQMLSGK